jgi:hypothetical protein
MLRPATTATCRLQPHLKCESLHRYEGDHSSSPSTASSMSSMSEIITNRRPNTSPFTMRLAVSRSPSVAPWPSPQLSLGDKCSPFGSQKCWEVTGPAEAISSDIFAAVRTLLNSRTEYLNEKEAKPCFVMFGFYMIGDDEAHASPTLLLSCERKGPRRKALKLVRESDIIAKKPGVRLAESVRPPLVMQPPILLGSQRGTRTVSPHDILYWHPRIPVCGVSVYWGWVEHQESFSENAVYLSRTTVGGIVCIGNKAFGLSTAHGFCRQDINTAAPDDDSDFDFSFDEWNEDADFNETSPTVAYPG